MPLLKPSEQNRQSRTGNGQQVDDARKVAEALFRPKPEPVGPSVPGDPSPAGAPVRKPRILSASPPLPVSRMNGEAPISSERQVKPTVSISQLARAHRERLKGMRAAILKKQDALLAKLNAIDCELRGIDAYEAAKKK
jgi:hypothetical protein